MKEHDSRDPVPYLVEAEIAARKAFDARLAEEPGLTDLCRRRIARYLQDPIWRGMAEIALNGVTSFEHGLMLRGAGLVRPAKFAKCHSALSDAYIACVECTDRGLEYLQDALSFGPDEDPARDAIIRAIMSYLVIDRGNGIVATRSLLDVAIEIDDRDLLRRVMSLANCNPAIDHETLDRVLTGASEQDRMEMADFYGSDDDDRRGAAIIDLSARDDLSGGA